MQYIYKFLTLSLFKIGIYIYIFGLRLIIRELFKVTIFLVIRFFYNKTKACIFGWFMYFEQCVWLEFLKYIVDCIY